jgi:ferritin-like metal-binding protein YciE
MKQFLIKKLHAMPRQTTKSKSAAAPKRSAAAGKSASGRSGSSRSSSNGSANRSSSNGTSTAQNTLLEKFLVDSLKDIYYAEKALTKALTKMNKAATTDELKQAFDDHLAQTEEHISRLEQVFEMLGKRVQAKKCEAMDGLIKEGETIIQETEKGTMTRDVALIIAAQKVEHYEIATYGGLVQLTKQMGMNEASDLLAETLQEEKDTDELLTSIAENNVNLQAEQEGEGEEEDTEE